MLCHSDTQLIIPGYDLRLSVANPMEAKPLSPKDSRYRRRKVWEIPEILCDPGSTRVAEVEKLDWCKEQLGMGGGEEEAGRAERFMLRVYFRHREPLCVRMYQNCCCPCLGTGGVGWLSMVRRGLVELRSPSSNNQT